MQLLKKKFVLLLGICLFSSCGSLPKKPKYEICAHDQPLKEVECYDTQTTEYRTIFIEDTNRYIMFSPDDWGLILLYIYKLEKKIRGSKNKNIRLTSKELQKILITSRLHNKKNEMSGTYLY